MAGIRPGYNYSWSPLILHADRGPVDVVARLLQDPRVRTTINVQAEDGRTALHHACDRLGRRPRLVQVLLQAGANPTLTNNNGRRPVPWLQPGSPHHQAAVAVLLEQASAAAEKTWLLVKARRPAVAATSNTVAPSCLQDQVAQGQPLPRLRLRRVELRPVAGGPDEDDEEDLKLQSFCAFLLGVGGPKGEGMPRDVFQVVMVPFLHLIGRSPNIWTCSCPRGTRLGVRMLVQDSHCRRAKEKEGGRGGGSRAPM